MGQFLEELTLAGLRYQLKQRNLNRTGLITEMRERLEAWLLENGHDPEEYIFKDPPSAPIYSSQELIRKERMAELKIIEKTFEIEVVPRQVASLVSGENYTEKSTDGSTFVESKVILPCCEELGQELCEKGAKEKQVRSMVTDPVYGSIKMESSEDTSDHSACVSPETLCMKADSEDSPLKPLESPDRVESSAMPRELMEVLVEQMELSEEPMCMPVDPVELVQPEELLMRHVELPVERTELVLELVESPEEPVDLPMEPMESAKSVEPADVSFPLEITEGSAQDFESDGRVPGMKSGAGDPVESLGSGDMVDQEGELGSGDVPRLKVAGHRSRSRAEIPEKTKAKGSGIHSQEIVGKQSDHVPKVKMKMEWMSVRDEQI